MLAEIMFLLFVLIVNMCKNSTKRENCAKLKDQGAFLPVDFVERDKLFTEYNLNIACSDGRYAPEKYRKYFKCEDNARMAYVEGLVSQEEIRQGRKPSFCIGAYNKYTFDPFAKFNTLYAKDFEDYQNRTGKWKLWPESL